MMGIWNLNLAFAPKTITKLGANTMVFGIYRLQVLFFSRKTGIINSEKMGIIAIFRNGGYIWRLNGMFTWIN